jgi:hypothetical protein
VRGYGTDQNLLIQAPQKRPFAVCPRSGYNTGVFIKSRRYTMQNLLESAAKKFGVPSEVLDLIGRQFISQIIDEFPTLLLPPIMNTLKQEYVKHGVEWIKQNAMSLREQFLLLKKLYGPAWILA